MKQNKIKGIPIALILACLLNGCGQSDTNTNNKPAVPTTELVVTAIEPTQSKEDPTESVVNTKEPTESVVNTKEPTESVVNTTESVVPTTESVATAAQKEVYVTITYDDDSVETLSMRIEEYSKKTVSADEYVSNVNAYFGKEKNYANIIASPISTCGSSEGEQEQGYLVGEDGLYIKFCTLSNTKDGGIISIVLESSANDGMLYIWIPGGERPFGGTAKLSDGTSSQKPVSYISFSGLSLGARNDIINHSGYHLSNAGRNIGQTGSLTRTRVPYYRGHRG